MVARKSSTSNRMHSLEGEDSTEEEIVDYAATADEFFATCNSSDDEDSDEDSSEPEVLVEGEGIDDENEESDVSSEDDDEGRSESNVVDSDVESIDEYPDENGDASENEQVDIQERQLASTANSVIISGTDEPCSFDLRNLLAMSSYPMDSHQLFSPISTTSKANVTFPIKNEIIPRNQGTFQVNEEFLLQKSIIGCTQLISALWKLPLERSDAGPMVVLPLFDESKIPRSLPPPPPKVETKWEKFAKAKGIGQNKEKRSAKVWDEAAGEWQYRHGYKKAGNDMEWPIMEVKEGDDPFQNPWEKQRDAKRKRVDKNMEQKMRNEERAGHLSKGTSTRILKSISASRKVGREGSRPDVPVGVPVDLKPSGKEVFPKHDSGTRHLDSTQLYRGKAGTAAALRATQVSTASLGRFDKMREGEPERTKAMSKAVTKKRKFESATDQTFVAAEAERSLKVLRALSDSSVTKEKDRKKGRLQSGETAYDYDYDDGLGASTFRKKKGRAGVGKMKKMTKKRVK